MRITNKLNTYNSINQVQTGMKNLYKSYNQLSSGLQIQNSYEGAGMYITNARLEYEYATLSQIEDASKLADELMKNTDSTMSEMEKLLTQFKVKVTEAANATQTPTSREVIAKELETIRQQIVDLANTSVNGQFLFSGSLTNTKPFDYSGNYYGDDKRLNIVTGDGVKNAYNIPGYDLFYKADNDFKKQITTNVSFTDNRYDLVQNKDKTRYLTGSDKISYLIGLNYVRDNTNGGGLEHDKDFDITPMQFPPTALYVQGVKPDGTSFKSAVLVEPKDTIQGMLDKIGALYGNTTTSKVVDVSINKSGQIQITDLKQGNTVLDFHAVAYTPQFETRDQLKNAIQSMAQQNPPMSGEDLTNAVLQGAFGNNNNNITTTPNQPVQVQIDGRDYNLNLHKTDFIFSKMTDTQNNLNGADYDNVYFETKDNKVIGNVSQVLKDGGAYATDSTKLSEVATGDLVNTTLNLKVSSRAGNTYDVTINLGTSTVSYQNGNPPQTITFPIMHTDPTTLNSGVVTPTNEITYRQLNDIIGLFADDRLPQASINVNANNQIVAADYQTYQDLVKTSRVSVNVDMDYKGRITVTDRLSAGTKIQIALTDSQSGVFTFPNNPPLTTTAQTTTGSALSFSANNALIIDEPHNDLINDLETMIQAVRYNYLRADSTGTYPRNTGMQGALERLDHLNEHIIKQRTIIGADQKAMSDTKKKVMTLKVNVKSTQNEVIGADLPEVYSQLMQQQLTYQAALKASTTLSQLSLLNYM